MRIQTYRTIHLIVAYHLSVIILSEDPKSRKLTTALEAMFGPMTSYNQNVGAITDEEMEVDSVTEESVTKWRERARLEARTLISRRGQHLTNPRPMTMFLVGDARSPPDSNPTHPNCITSRS